MLSERLPVHIVPRRMAESGRQLKGQLAIASLERLGASLLNNEGQVDVELEFGIDVQGIRYVAGRLSAEVQLRCQRCIEPMAYTLEAKLLLGVVGSESESERLPEHYDPLVAGDEPLFLNDVIEDELILSLPIIPRHPEGECQGGQAGLGESETEVRRGEAESPFAVLASLKKTNAKV